MNVYICNLPDVTNGVLYIPYVYGALRAHAEQDERLRGAYRFGAPLWRMDALEQMLEHFQEPAVVGFSTYVWNERNSHRLAAAVKERFPESLVVFGGPQIPNRPSDYLERHPWVDLLVHGEGETAFTGLLRESLEEAPDWNRVPGLSFLEGPEQRFSAPGQRMKELNFPSPYLEGYFDELVEQVRAKNPYASLMACMETNRGCPYSCSFCDWGMATMSKLRRHSEERVKAEFEWASRHEILGIILNDANFGILPRDVELAGFVAELKERSGHPRYFYPLGLAKNNKDRAFAINKIIIDHHFDPFEMNVNFSLQATSQTTLDAIARQNIPIDNYRALADRYYQQGYGLTPDLILPLPGETLESFKEGFADLASWEHVTRIRVYPCCILPNAPMADPDYRERWGLVTRTVPLGAQEGWFSSQARAEVELIEAVVSTSTMSEAEHAQAKVFMALVNALEVYGLTRDLRRYVGRFVEISPGAFYQRLLEFQRRREGTLAAALAPQDEVLNQTYVDELVGSTLAATHDGKQFKHHKVIAYDALTRPEQFRAELEEFVRELGVEPPAEFWRYQYEQWVLPDYDPEQEHRFRYEWDWPSFLEGGEEPRRESIELFYQPRPEWREYGYSRGMKSWESFALNVTLVDTYCLLGA